MKKLNAFSFGDIAQLARAPALQAGSQGFEPPYLQKCKKFGMDWGLETESPPIGKGAMEGAGRGRRRAGRSKQDVCDWKPSPLISMYTIFRKRNIVYIYAKRH